MDNPVKSMRQIHGRTQWCDTNSVSIRSHMQCRPTLLFVALQRITERAYIASENRVKQLAADFWFVQEVRK